MKFLVTTALLGILATGCASTPPFRTVKLDSDPEGMRVFYGEGGTPQIAEHSKGYVGTTPCTANVPCDRHGCFDIEGIAFYNSFVQATAVFIAEPPFGTTNLFQQEVTYHGDAHFQSPDKVPPGVFFDMHKEK
jgi:hypothetical protein